MQYSQDYKISEIEYRTLLSIKKGIDIFESLSTRFTHVQIMICLLGLSKQGYLTYDAGHATLTEKGNGVLHESHTYHKISILTKEKLKTKISLDDIYVPHYAKGDYNEIKN